MSELRDVANAFEAVNTRLTSIGECMLELLTELTNLRHDQNGHFQGVRALAEESDKVLQQVRERVMPTIERLDGEVQMLRNIRQEDMRALSARIRQVEDKAGIEVTR